MCPPRGRYSRATIPPPCRKNWRRTIEHPGLGLVGVYVHSEDKVGRDAGELCGIDPVGVAATQDIEEIIALRPDCVLYMPHECNYDAVCRLLESGTNIVTTRREFHNPASMDAALRERVEKACERGNSSIHSTGSSPGVATEALPLVLTSIQRRLEHLRESFGPSLQLIADAHLVAARRHRGERSGGDGHGRHGDRRRLDPRRVARRTGSLRDSS